MEWYEIVELICSIISTIGIIISAIIITHNYLKKIDVYVSYEYDHLKIFAVSLYKQIIIKDIKIKSNGKIINGNDTFFSNGRNELILGTDQMIIIKDLVLRNYNNRWVLIKLTLLNNKKIRMMCLVRR